MGYGDEIMVTGRARKLRETDDRKCVVLDRKGLIRGDDPGRRQEYETFRMCPHIEILDRFAFERGEADRDDYQVFTDGAGVRPYVDYGRMTLDFAKVYPGQPFKTKGIRQKELPWRYNFKHRPERGDLSLLRRSTRHGAVVVQPYLKPGTSPNKQWPVERWQQLIDKLNSWGIKPQVVMPVGHRVSVTGIKEVWCHTWTEALTYLSGIRTAILPDGGIQHALAALGIPCVVIYGGFTHPGPLGYDMHTNLWDRSEETPCGQWVSCDHCTAAMDRIGVEDVCSAAAKALENSLPPERDRADSVVD